MDLPLDGRHVVLFNEVYDLDGTGRTTYGSNMGPCAEGATHAWELQLTQKEGEEHSHAHYRCAHCGKTIEVW